MQNRHAVATRNQAIDDEMPGRTRAADDQCLHCLLYTSDAADERSSVDLGGRRIIKKKKQTNS